MTWASRLDAVDVTLLPKPMAADIENALTSALQVGSQFSSGASPEAIFRSSVAACARDISLHQRGLQFQTFLLKGPPPFEKELPDCQDGQWLSDEETASVVSYIYAFIINHFKGVLAELLAVRPVLQLLNSLKSSGSVPSEATLYVGDAATVPRPSGTGWLKGADFHILDAKSLAPPHSAVLFGVAEVKAGAVPMSAIMRQLKRHCRRANSGLRLSLFGQPLGSAPVQVTAAQSVHQIAVTAADWPLTRGYRFSDAATDDPRAFFPDEAIPVDDSDTIVTNGTNHHIVLRWSREALSSVAFDMTLWYFECVGERIYADGVPTGWEEMTPSQAGRNAAKMRLYDAIHRARNPAEWNRAVGLFNSYSFGWAIGTGFRTIERGLTPVITFQDLRELPTKGHEALGWKLRE